MLWLFSDIQAQLLKTFGCRVFEDLSAICAWGAYSVPW